MSMKTVTNWRHLIDLPPVEYCGYMNGAFKVPYFEESINELKKDFPTLPWSCPLTPGKYYILNYTNVEKNRNATPAVNSKQKLDATLPNGVYKNVILLSSPNDPTVFRIEWHIQIQSRLNDESF